MSPYYLPHPVHISSGTKAEYPEKTHDFRHSVDYTHFTWGLGWSPPYWGSNSEPYERPVLWPLHHWSPILRSTSEDIGIPAIMIRKRIEEKYIMELAKVEEVYGWPILTWKSIRFTHTDQTLSPKFGGHQINLIIYTTFVTWLDSKLWYRMAFKRIPKHWQTTSKNFYLTQNSMKWKMLWKRWRNWETVNWVVVEIAGLTKYQVSSCYTCEKNKKKLYYVEYNLLLA